MNITQNVKLSEHSTMRLGGLAKFYMEANSKEDIRQAVEWAENERHPLIMIGDGSNIVWSDEGFEGLVVMNSLLGFDVFNEDEVNVYLTIGAGENWDSVVKRCVNAGYSGIEQLSLIPGKTGATPVQNVGAYGREISEVLVSIQAYDIHERKYVNLANAECGFGYRTSRFKTTDRNRFLIVSITLHLSKTNPSPPFYAPLKEYFVVHNVTTYTPQAVREAVVAIRSAKLPNPAEIPNNGSFFGNPIVSQDKLDQLIEFNTDLKYWRLDDGQIKLSAAWLIEKAGFKNYYDKATGIATWPKQPLVFINQSAKTTADLMAFKQKVVDAVVKKFGIKLVQEPELLP